jgi:peroxiredoxin
MFKSAALALLVFHASVVVAAELGTIGPFALVDVDGVRRTNDDWRKAKAVVYCVLGTECPVSNGQSAQMQRLADRYTPLGAAFVGIYAEPTVTADDARKHGVEYGLKFTRLLDPQHRLITQTGARTMPTFVVVRRDGTIAYRGRMDDRWSPEGKRRDEPRTHELVDAIDAVLADREPPVAETRTFGCLIQSRK